MRKFQLVKIRLDYIGPDRDRRLRRSRSKRYRLRRSRSMVEKVRVGAVRGERP